MDIVKNDDLEVIYGITRPDGWYFIKEIPWCQFQFDFEVLGGPFPTQKAAETAWLDLARAHE
jgi:hypothetical protein